jgi:hypothetical protein
VSAFRVFIAFPGEIVVVEAAPGVEEAWDLMAADRVPPERAARLAVAAARSGRDPVAWARHFVELRQTLRREVSNADEAIRGS